MLKFKENNKLIDEEWKCKMEKEIKSLYLEIETLKYQLGNITHKRCN